MMSDEEIICAWMEKRPADGVGLKVEHANDPRWWTYSYQVLPRLSGGGKEFHWQWHARDLTLDKLWEVEEQLPADQRLDYWLELSKGGPPETGYWRLVHASAADKIKALAVVLSTPPATTAGNRK